MEQKDDRFLSLLNSFIESLIISLVFAIVLTQFIIRPVRVEGLSMYPTLNDKELGFSNIIATKVSSVKRFDVVVIHLKDQNKYIVKRVIGLPGEEIEYRDEVLYVNGEALEEPFLDNPHHNAYVNDEREFMQDFGPVLVDEDHYFVLGDNRPNSIDSRNYGLFSKDMISSKNVFVFLPFKSVRRVRRP